MKRNDFKYALEKIKEYRRRLYKGDVNKEIIVKDKKVIADGNDLNNGYPYLIKNIPNR